MESREVLERREKHIERQQSVTARPAKSHSSRRESRRHAATLRALHTHASRERAVPLEQRPRH